MESYQATPQDAGIKLIWIIGSYLLAIAGAELMVIYYSPVGGMILLGALLQAMLVHAVVVWEQPMHKLLLGLIFAPLIRILSLTLPLAHLERQYWFLISSLPLFAATFYVARLLGYSRRQLGLRIGRTPLQLGIGLTGLLLGVIEYAILKPDPLVAELRLSHIWLPALIFLICTGLLEELIFRGLLQQAAIDVLGEAGLAFVTALFAILHLGHRSLVDVAFVFGVALFFSWVVLRTGSIAGISLAHGLTNVTLYLLIPLVLSGRGQTPFYQAPSAPNGPVPGLGASLVTPTASPWALPSATSTATRTPFPAHSATATTTRTTTPTRTPTPEAAAEEACQPPLDWKAYRVQRGDTLWFLSRLVGLRASKLRQANCLATNQLFVGQVIYLPWRPAVSASLARNPNTFNPPPARDLPVPPANRP